ncbi:MAG: IPTL-CTERM sorting domain-containing protein [Burkholderiales bacterium]|nr:IPTL-CTERM sorting domain-containing protein [Burkholderiales bacterium]
MFTPAFDTSAFFWRFFFALCGALLLSSVSLTAQAQPVETSSLFFDASTGNATSGKFYVDTNNNGFIDSGDSEYTGQATAWGWNSGTSTLTLNNFTWTTSAYFALRIVGGNIVIELANGSTNTFTSTSTVVAGEPAESSGIFSASFIDITITGGGTLNALAGDASAASRGIHLKRGAFTLQSGTVNANGLDGVTGYSVGIYVENGNMGINGGALSAVGGDAGIGSYGIDCEGTLSVSGGTVAAKSGAFAYNGSYGIQLKGNHFNMLGGTVEAAGESSAISSAANALPNAYTYWKNTTTSDPGGAGTFYYLGTGGTAYAYSSGDKYVRVREEIMDDLTITGGTLGIDYTYTGGVLTITQNGTYTIGMRPGVTTTTNRIVVDAGVEADITLDGVSIDRRADSSHTISGCAFSMADAEVNLALANNNMLMSGGGCAGLQAPAGSTLSIGGAGSLTATGGQAAAGIGGGDNQDGGNITITGGTITATGGAHAAGIGGGADGGSGNILIYGKTTVVTATAGAGSVNAENIGAGDNGAAGNVFVALLPANLQDSFGSIGNEVTFTATPVSSGTVTASLPAPFSATVDLLVGLATPKKLSIITTFSTDNISFGLVGYPSVTQTGDAVRTLGASVNFVLGGARNVSSIPVLNPMALVLLALALGGMGFGLQRRKG